MKTNKILAGLPSLDDFIEEWLPKLPQANQIDKDNAKRWYYILAKRDEDRFAWHFKRLMGIGGSEIGEIAQRALGYDATYTQVEHIINQKLMIAPPDLPNDYMRRGILAEDMLAKIFHEDYKAQRRKDVIKKIGSHSIGWMKGNVDDVIEIEGALGLTDYKAASNVPDATYLIYQAQLQFYDYLLADALGITQGIMPDELKLRTEPLAFDFMLNVFMDWEAGKVKPIFVPYDGNLMNTMIEAGDAVWMHITQGESLPEWMLPRKNTNKPPLELPEAQKERLRLAETRSIQIKSAIEMLVDAEKEVQNEIIELAKEASSSTLLKDVVMPLAATSMSARRTVDQERWQSILNGMEESAKETAIEKTLKTTAKLDEAKVIKLLDELAKQGVNIELSALCKTEFDTDAVAQYCLEKGYAPAINESVSISKGRSKIAKAAAQNIADGVKYDIESFIRVISREPAVAFAKEKDGLEAALGNA